MDNTERIAKLSPAKRALLELALKEKELVGLAEPGIPCAHTAGPAPLSFAQQRLWFLSQLEPDSSAYNQPKALRLSGAVNIEALKKALDAIVCRHEVLRTTFTLMDGGIPVQSVQKNRSVDLPLVDLSSCPDDKRNKEMQRAITEITERRFDLSRDLMIRMALLRRAPSEHVLLLVTHHIAFDGWSSGILWREIASLYAAFSTGEPNPLPDLPVQYADYAVWQRNYLQGEVLEKQLSYWKKQLSGVPVLELPVDRPRPSVQSYRSTRQIFAVPKSFVEKLKTLSREQGATLFMILLAAFQILLHRYTGQEDIAVGSPIANRTRAEVEGLIGFFVNTLVLRTDVSGNPSFRELVARVRKMALEAYEHQDLPFEKLVEELNPERRLGQTPLFQVMFVLQNTPRKPAEIPGVEVSPVEVSIQTAKFDLTLSMTESADSLRGVLEYNTDLFEEATIRRMAGHFQTLLHDIAAQPDRRISELSLLTEAERAQLLVDWNDTKRDYPKDQSIHDLFEAQVERSPDAVAVVFEDKQLTYRELNARANQLAHHLRRLGVGPEILVGIFVERSLEMIVGLLGILKAGAAYVPLDPSYPKERLAFILEDTRAIVLLTQQHLIGNLPEHSARTVCLDSDWNIITREDERNLVGSTEGDNLAYVMYTSGSTGQPKGVSVIHRGVARLVKGTNYAELTDKEVFLQFAPLSFDASTFEIWACLLSGAKLVVFPPHTPSLDELGEAIKQSQVSTLWLTSALFQLMVEDQIDSLAGVKQLLAGGDVLSAPHVKSALQKLPQCRLINGYGPTENTTFTCCYQMTASEQVGDSVSIGRPIANTQVYLLDPHMNPLSIGVSGELYIGGGGLARQYFNNPKLTAEKFVPNPFGSEAGARLYKTGDLARYRPDGNIEFLGRTDNQVKIRGFRIELGAIEAVLTQHRSVRQAAVVPREGTSGNKLLVAYLAASEESPPKSSEIRAFLQQKLPAYMIPSLFIFLGSLPLTSNGKIDRRALPMTGEDRVPHGQDYMAPLDPVEYQLVAIWEELLSVRPIGVRDDFFELGGHSLLAAQLMYRIEQIYNKKIPLATMFAKATIRQLSKAIVNQHMAECQSPMVQVQAGGSKPPFFFLHGDFLGGGVYTLNLARGLGKDQPFYVLNPHGVDGKPMPATIEAMASSYICMIQAVQPHGPYFLGGYCNGGVVAYEMARQLTQQKEKVELVALVAAPVKNTPQMRLLQHFISCIAYLCRFESEEKMTLFLQSRDLYLYYSDRIEDVAQWPLNQRLAWAFRQLKRGVRQAPRLFTAAISRLTLNGRKADSEEFFEREDLLRSTGRAMKSYIPRRYAGRVVLFQPGEENPDGAEDPTMGWSRVASAIEVQMVPGGHISCVSTHVKTLAALIRASLDAI